MSVYLSMGSNRGDRRAFIDAAVAAIAAQWPQALLRQSPAVESPAWGYASDARYLNVGVALDFDDPAQQPEPMALLDALQAIERQISTCPHRNPDGTYCDRDIDIDIIDIDGVTMATDRLTLPHPRAGARRFVTEPMQFLCPGWSPDRKGLAHLKKTTAEMCRDTVEQFRHKAKAPLAVVLDNIRSLNNIGSIFRTCDAFAVDRMALCGVTGTPPSPEIHKTALGAEDSVAWSHYSTTLEAVEALRADGWTIAALEQVHGSVALDTYRWHPGTKIAIVAGNEVAGVDEAVVAAADLCLEIPQAGTKHSLNVAVSTAVALWHIYAQIISQNQK